MKRRRNMICLALALLCGMAAPGAAGNDEDVFRSARTPPAERAAAGLALAERQCGEQLFDFATTTLADLLALPGVPPELRAQAYRRMLRILTRDLNEPIEAYAWASRMLQDLPRMPEAEKEELRQLMADCLTKRNGRAVLPAERAAAEKLAAKVRRDHPRLFFDRETWPKIVRHWSRPEIREFYQKQVRSLAEAAPDRPPLEAGLTGRTRRASGRYEKVPRPCFYGTEAAACALVWMLEGDRSFRDKAIRLLTVSAAAARASYRAGVTAGDDYYNGTMLYAMAACDWLFAELSPRERREIAGAFLEYAVRFERDGACFVTGRDRPTVSGFYGVRMLKWYAGLLTLGEGIDDEAALKMLYEGWRDHEEMLLARDRVSGRDGGFVSVANNYLMTTYLWSTFNYLASFRAAFGVDRAPETPHLKYFPQWCAWNAIPGPHGFLDFGLGDTGNLDKKLPDPSLALLEVLHFLPDDPELRRTALPQVRNAPLDLHWPDRPYRRLHPLLLWNLPELPKNAENNAPELPEHARFFSHLGVIFLRSGSTPDDTYASISVNKRIAQHRHYDANSFMIYKHGFLALDTGTRIGFQRGDFEHLNAYYAQTVAHNAVLIHMPEEPMPPYWGSPRRDRTRYFCHGGQDRTTGDRCVAFDASDRRYVYAAGDATPVYSEKKCRLALRQFVFILPDIFVIADRVTSTRPEYRKDWLLHAQNEPVPLDDRTFRFDAGSGRLFCRTVFPKKFRRAIVGGPGREFEASGQNWKLPPDAQKLWNGPNHLGRRRVEITPAEARTDDRMLHVIQVGKNTLPAMVKTEPVETPGTFGVRLTADTGTWTVEFASDGAPGGRIRLEKDGTVLLDRPLAEGIPAPERSRADAGRQPQ